MNNITFIFGIVLISNVGIFNKANSEIIHLECFNENLRQIGAYESTQGLVGVPDRLTINTSDGTVHEERYDRCTVLDWGDPLMAFSCISFGEVSLDNKVAAFLFDRRSSRLVTEVATKHSLKRRPNFKSTGTAEYLYDYSECERRHF